jgi:hypothetical protein
LFFLVTGACASHDESLGCAELVVSCPGDSADQQWWLAKSASTQSLQIQNGECGSWLAFIENGATARYDGINIAAVDGKMRLRVVVSGDPDKTTGGTLTVFADSDMTTPMTSCVIAPTGGWFNWLVVDCGPLTLRGSHSLTFKFSGKDQYVFNFAAFGAVRTSTPDRPTPDCTVTGPKNTD